MSPLGFLTTVCKGCIYRLDGNSDLRDSERVEHCNNRCTPQIDKGYSTRKPFTLNREKCEIKEFKIKNNIEKTKIAIPVL